MRCNVLSALRYLLLRSERTLLEFLRRKAHSRSRTPHHLSLGARAERIALSYLKRKGYRLLTRNYKTSAGEVDIVAKHRGEIIFVEVKSGISHPPFYPRDKVDEKKRRKIVQVAETYLRRKGLSRAKVRFDILEVSFKTSNDQKPRITHLEGAF